jgi:hypothetical protein
MLVQERRRSVGASKSFLRDWRAVGSERSITKLSHRCATLLSVTFLFTLVEKVNGFLTDKKVRNKNTMPLAVRLFVLVVSLAVSFSPVSVAQTTSPATSTATDIGYADIRMTLGNEKVYW